MQKGYLKILAYCKGNNDLIKKGIMILQKISPHNINKILLNGKLLFANFESTII